MGHSDPSRLCLFIFFIVFIYFFYIYFYLFILLCWVLVAVCGIYFPDQGSNLGPLHWEHGVLATRSPEKSPILFFKYLFIDFLKINLFLAVLGLHCCAGFCLVAGSKGYSLAVVHGLLTAVAFLIVELLRAPGCTGSLVVVHRLRCLFQGMWDLHGSGIEPMSPVLAGRSFTTEPPGKPLFTYLAALGLSCSIWASSSLPRDQTCAPCIGRVES